MTLDLCPLTRDEDCTLLACQSGQCIRQQLLDTGRDSNGDTVRTIESRLRHRELARQTTKGSEQ